jgi:hypothetical protein
MTHETSTPASRPATSIRAVRSLRYKRVTWERVNLAVAHYVQKRPLKTHSGLIEAPTLEELAVAYDVSVADIQQKLDEWGLMEDDNTRRSDGL